MFSADRKSPLDVVSMCFIAEADNDMFSSAAVRFSNSRTSLFTSPKGLYMDTSVLKVFKL